MSWPGPPSDAPCVKPPEPPGRRKPTLRRYTWSRLHAELPGLDIWGLVAEMAASDRARVEAFVWRLEVYASTNRPRGSVEGFPLRALAVTWRCDADELARIYAALEDPDVGWVEGDAVVTFWERNPDEEDPTGAERARRSRKRRKIVKTMQARGAQTAEIIDELEAAGVSYPQIHSVTRDTVTVTARSDQIKKHAVENSREKPPPVTDERPQAVQRDSGDSGYNPADPEPWLATEGQRLIAQRLNEELPRAARRVERWVQEIGEDRAALRAILDRLADSDLVVAQFLQEVKAAIARHRHALNGPQLPLPPAAVTRKVG